LLAGLLERLSAEGRIVVAESLPTEAQRLYRLPAVVEPELLKRWKAAEDRIYADLGSERTQEAFDKLLVETDVPFRTERLPLTSQRRLAPAAVERWFGEGSYASRIGASGELNSSDLQTIERQLRSLTQQRSVS